MDKPIIGVVGLGYVGLPLAVELGKRYRVVGYDLGADKVDAYCRHIDPAGEVSTHDLIKAVRSGGLEPTTQPERLSQAEIFIVAVPTPVTQARAPDFGPLAGASRTVGKYMKKGSIVVFESTVYPGATEEICVPLLEEHSGLVWKRDFHVGYSPERINPGDREHTLTRIRKVVAGDEPDTLNRVADLYGSIIEAGVFRATSIRVAEAAKVIENTQRDLNIALMNELAIIFDRLEIDTSDVLEAASTKWNFLKFSPGLVGGHCIGVDPYYLTHKAEMIGYHPQVILAGRRINDGMGKFVAEKTIKLMIADGSNIKGATVNILGLTFKEDCPDLRNSRVPDIVSELESYGVRVCIHDPVANETDAKREYGVDLLGMAKMPLAQAVIIAVAHREFRDLPVKKLGSLLAGRTGCLVDVKSVIDPSAIRQDLPGVRHWRL